MQSDGQAERGSDGQMQREAEREAEAERQRQTEAERDIFEFGAMPQTEEEENQAHPNCPVEKRQ